MGAFSYHDLMYKISVNDWEILNKIIKDNIVSAEKLIASCLAFAFFVSLILVFPF